MHSGCAELMLVGYILTAVLNLALGNWKVAVAMLVPVAGLFMWSLLAAWWCRCKMGDRVQVILGPHAGMQGTIVGRGETGAHFMVQPFTEEPADAVEIHVNHLTKARRADSGNKS